jgi:hypothetical protein
MQRRVNLEVEPPRRKAARAIDVQLESVAGDVADGLPPAQRLGYAIYYTANATETRMAIVTNVVRQIFPSNSAFGSELMACWEKFHNRLGKGRGARNAIAHGNVRTYGMGEPVEYRVRLVPPILEL